MRPVDHAILRFPDRVEAIRRLYLRDHRFRAICEDIQLAATSLQRFESRADAGTRPEIAEYRKVLQELEKELLDQLSGPAT